MSLSGVYAYATSFPDQPFVPNSWPLPNPDGVQQEIGALKSRVAVLETQMRDLAARFGQKRRPRRGGRTK